jgi:hypothetical protein
MTEIKGYRTLTAEELDNINRVKYLGDNILADLLERALTNGADPHWVAIAKTDFQRGSMALVRAIAQPTGF